jgi:hypothetical protein
MHTDYGEHINALEDGHLEGGGGKETCKPKEILELAQDYDQGQNLASVVQTLHILLTGS